MSPLDSILGLEGLFIEQVQRAHDIHVWARPRKRACCVYCANPRVRIKATYTRTLKHTRQGNQLMWLHLRVPKYHCLQCNRYFRHRIAGIRPRLRATEVFRLEVFEAHDGGVTQRKLSRTHRIGTATVERWYQSFTRQRHTNVVIVALANKIARTIWAVLAHNRPYQKEYVSTKPA